MKNSLFTINIFIGSFLLFSSGLSQSVKSLVESILLGQWIWPYHILVEDPLLTTTL